MLKTILRNYYISQPSLILAFLVAVVQVLLWYICILFFVRFGVTQGNVLSPHFPFMMTVMFGLEVLPSLITPHYLQMLSPPPLMSYNLPTIRGTMLLKLMLGKTHELWSETMIKILHNCTHDVEQTRVSDYSVCIFVYQANILMYLCLRMCHLIYMCIYLSDT